VEGGFMGMLMRKYISTRALLEESVDLSSLTEAFRIEHVFFAMSLAVVGIGISVFVALFEISMRKKEFWKK